MKIEEILVETPLIATDTTHACTLFSQLRCVHRQIANDAIDSSEVEEVRRKIHKICSENALRIAADPRNEDAARALGYEGAQPVHVIRNRLRTWVNIALHYPEEALIFGTEAAECTENIRSGISHTTIQFDLHDCCDIADTEIPYLNEEDEFEDEEEDLFEDEEEDLFEDEEDAYEDDELEGEEELDDEEEIFDQSDEENPEIPLIIQEVKEICSKNHESIDGITDIAEFYQEISQLISENAASIYAETERSYVAQNKTNPKELQAKQIGIQIEKSIRKVCQFLHEHQAKFTCKQFSHFWQEINTFDRQVFSFLYHYVILSVTEMYIQRIIQNTAFWNTIEQQSKENITTPSMGTMECVSIYIQSIAANMLSTDTE
jgi:hypothetical protein